MKHGMKFCGWGRAVAWAIFALCLLQGGHSAWAEEVKCAVKGGELVGTLEAPEGEGKRPLVIMVAGSGPTDRDGNNPLTGKNNSLRMLAEGLKGAEVATLRYDKRGIAGSAKAMGKEEDVRFDDYAEDAGAWIQWARKEGRFGKIFVLGHSEGAFLATLAAGKQAVDGLITVSGPGRAVQDILREQLEKTLPEDLKKQAFEILDSLVAGKTVAEVPKSLAALYRPSVQPYMISCFQHDPAKAIGELKMPVLIVQGSTDIQVPVSDAQLLAKAAGGRGRLVVVEGMNHVLKMVANDGAAQKKSYADPSMPVAEEVVKEVVAFVRMTNDK